MKDYNIPVKLNRNIKLIYELLGDPERIYMGEWTIMSLKEAIERYEGFCKENRKDVFDIGYKYRINITVISCDLNTHLLFYRPDGEVMDMIDNTITRDIKMVLINMINFICNGFII